MYKARESIPRNGQMNLHKAGFTPKYICEVDENFAVGHFIRRDWIAFYARKPFLLNKNSAVIYFSAHR